MSDVTHQKWWGWGVEGIAFHHEDKPHFAPFVLDKIGIDLSLPGTPPPQFDDIEVPESRLGEDLGKALRSAVGDHHVITDDMDRVVHTYGKGMRDLVWVRAGHLPRVPDAVVYPANEAEVQAVVDLVIEKNAVLIPFGGGSNISGSLTPPAHEDRAIVSLDMGRMNQVLEIDEGSGLARIQAGGLGPDIEAQLNPRGWTMGHQPDSFKHSTLGGWIATRSSGMQSDRYGDISEIARGMRVVQPGKVLVLRPLPSTSTGPSVREMILGSEGRLGVITEAWVNVHRLPENREVIAYLFPNWAAGLGAMRDISTSDASPSITRVSDANETGFSLATRKESTSLSGKLGPLVFDLLAKRGWDLEKVCISYIGYEGGAAKVRADKSIVGKIIGNHGGIRLGKGPGALYDQKKFDTPYIRDFLLDRGAVGDVSETAAPWEKLGEVYHRATRGVKAAFEEIGVKGYVMCHLSHSYHSGACLYFTFGFPPNPEGDFLTQYDVVKTAIQQAFIDGGGTLSHHHGVGTDHAPWMEQDISVAGVDQMVGLLKAVDPSRNLNPGSLIPPAREW
ncbi:FAD-binding oxidoreductase [Pseudactinotalea terrae]|uniref:FAD-binding oxidoreductase n=1 Tax=Pseudactinotalea terrae TaxID=1743262 RepID=UPI0012E1E077|nr:FAD-binding oxidoreductase [Pseudactinotalea terrae]